MIIIETCPKCGHDLQNLMLASNPPIPKKECPNCGWSWRGEKDRVVRIPFGCDDLIDCYRNEFLKMGYSDLEATSLAALAVEATTIYCGEVDITNAVNSLVNMCKEYGVEGLGDIE